MENGERMSGSILYACLIAGPVFLTCTILASLYLQLPKPIVIPPQEVGGFLIMLMPALLVGFFLALVPVVIGTAALWSLGKQNRTFRHSALWTATGAAAGATLAILFGVATEAQQFGFALVATSAVCARVARKFANWEN